MNEESRMELNTTQQQQISQAGDLLRQKRKELNVSLKEAENATSIRTAYLQALEEGEMNKLISPIYAQGFFKQYASFLGIDGEKIVREHPGMFSKLETQEFDYGIGTLEVRGQPGGGVRWFPNSMWVIIFVCALVAAWYFAHFLGVM
jgi:cytoskeletal protein RodZ